MTYIVCIDNRFGLSFHNRRQSQDRLLRQRILSYAAGKLWMRPNSAKQFADCPPDTFFTADSPYAVPPDGYWFSEDPETLPAVKLILYRWNRVYPADAHFHFPGGQDAWLPVSMLDFPGYSHEQITEIIYIPKEDASCAEKISL